MITCKKCGDEFSSRVNIDGKARVLSSRKYCLVCSPFGQHNTRKINGESRKDQPPHKCSCGETNPNKFYGNKRYLCGKCHNQYNLKKGQEKRDRAIAYKGGKCELCGYSKYSGALDFHHIDPKLKDPKFPGMRSWSWDKIKNEIDKCALLCSNCHREVHAGVHSQK